MAKPTLRRRLEWQLEAPTDPSGDVAFECALNGTPAAARASCPLGCCSLCSLRSLTGSVDWVAAEEGRSADADGTGGGEVGRSECEAASELETSARVVMTVVLLVGAVVVTGECGAAVGEEAPVQSSSANALREAVGEWPGEKMPPPPFVSRRTDGLADSTVICSSGSDADALLDAEGAAAETALVGGDAEDAARGAAGFCRVFIRACRCAGRAIRCCICRTRAG